MRSKGSSMRRRFEDRVVELVLGFSDRVDDGQGLDATAQPPGDYLAGNQCPTHAGRLATFIHGVQEVGGLEG